MESCWGGTPVETWSSSGALQQCGRKARMASRAKDAVINVCLKLEVSNYNKKINMSTMSVVVFFFFKIWAFKFSLVECNGPPFGQHGHQRSPLVPREGYFHGSYMKYSIIYIVQPRRSSAVQVRQMQFTIRISTTAPFVRDQEDTQRHISPLASSRWVGVTSRKFL